MPKYSRLRNNKRTASVELIPVVDPTNDSTSSTTITSTGTTSSSDTAAERRRERYEARQRHQRAIRTDASIAEQQELYRTISQQSHDLQQLGLEELRTLGVIGNDSIRRTRLNQIVATAEHLVSNLQQLRQLGRYLYDESRLLLQETLMITEKHRQLILKTHELRGSNDRSTRRYLRNNEGHRRSVQQRIERLEQSYEEEDTNRESMQAQVRRVTDFFRERERYNAVRSAFLEPTESRCDGSNDDRTSTGRVLKSTGASVSTAPNQVSPLIEASIGLYAHFGDNDTTPIDHDICVICRYEYKEEDVIVRNSIRESHTRCNHLFHQACVTAWIESSQKAECPCCRQPFVVKI